MMSAGTIAAVLAAVIALNLGFVVGCCWRALFARPALKRGLYWVARDGAAPEPVRLSRGEQARRRKDRAA